MRLLVIAPPSFTPLGMLRERAADLDLVVSDDAATLRAAAGLAEAIVVAPRAGRLLREVWPAAERLRWVHTLAAGVDTLLFPELTASDVILTNARGVFAPALGEFALAAMLYFAKEIPRMLRNQRAQQWAPFNVARLEGQTVGIVGYGSIGRAVASRAAALGMVVVASRRRPEQFAGDPLVVRGYAPDRLGDLLAESDYVVVAMPLTPSTQRMIGGPQLARMKPSSVVINIGRAPVIDEAALIETLRSQRIRGAALDVFETEPLPPGHPFWSLDNVLLSPHCADHTADSHARSVAFFLDNLARFRRGEPLENIVDKVERY